MPRYLLNILPVFAMLAVTVLAMVLAIRKKEFRFSVRIWSVISILLLLVAVALQSLQPTGSKWPRGLMPGLLKVFLLKVLLRLWSATR